MKNVLLIALTFFSTFSLAQSLSPAVREIIDAENSFASLSKKLNTRDAFIANLANNGIVFERSEPVSGKEVWLKRKADSSLLFWWPVFSEVAASGDFGYNTGPFEWSTDRSGAKPVAYGYFSSVWIKGKDGVWKVAIDMGMGMPSADTRQPVLSTSKIKSVSNEKGSSKEDKLEILEKDRKYIDELNKQSVSFIATQLSQEARIHRTGHFPMINQSEINSFADNREGYHFEQSGGEMASSGDLAFTYGKVNALTKADKKPVTFNYLRIWKKENGKTWKIVLDVIGG